MQVTFNLDSFSRIVGDIEAGGEHAVVTSSDAASAARALLDAIASAERDGYGECVWREGAGEYWWVLRRDGADVTCAIMWSRGTLTGWQHLLRAETTFEEFAAAIQQGLARLPFTAVV